MHRLCAPLTITGLATVLLCASCVGYGRRLRIPARDDPRITSLWSHGLSGKRPDLQAGTDPGRAEFPTASLLSSLYARDETAGAGGFGICTFGRHLEYSTPCVVKKIKLRDASKEYLRELLERKTFDFLLQPDEPHPNVMHFFDYMLGPDAVIVTMPALHGPELFDYIVENAPLSKETCQNLTTQALAALSYIHSKDVIHRDVKPENFRFKQRDPVAQLVLFDFGLACRCGDDPKEPCGSIPYVAPEILTRRVTTKADMWSYGVVLYVMMTGQEPFPGITMRDLQMRLKEPAQLEKDLDKAFAAAAFVAAPAEAGSLVTELLVSDPKRRLSAVAASEHRWHATPASEHSHDAGNLWRVAREAYFETRKSLASLGALKRALKSKESSESESKETSDELPAEAEAPKVKRIASTPLSEEEIAKHESVEAEAESEYNRLLNKYRNGAGPADSELLDLLEAAKASVESARDARRAAQGLDGRPMSPQEVAKMARLEEAEEAAQAKYSRLLHQHRFGTGPDDVLDLAAAAKAEVEAARQARRAAEAGDFSTAKEKAELARLEEAEDDARRDYYRLLHLHRYGAGPPGMLDEIEAAQLRIKKASTARLAAESGEAEAAKGGSLGGSLGGAGLRVLEVECQETRVEESVFMVGSLPELGAWDPRKALKMTTDGKSFPVWTADLGSLDLSSSGAPVEFKFVVQRDDLTGRLLWEMINNRRLDGIMKAGDTVRMYWNKLT